MNHEDIKDLRAALYTVYRNSFELAGTSQIVARVLERNGFAVDCDPDTGKITVTLK